MLLYICIVIILISTLKVQHISCIQNGTSCSIPLYSPLETLKGSSFFFTDLNQTLVEKHNGVLPFKVLSIKRKLPGTIIVTLAEEKPLYLIFTNDTQSTLVGVSENGSTVSFDANSSSTPIVNVPTAETAFTEKTLVPTFHETIKKIMFNSRSPQYTLRNINYVSSTEIILNYDTLPPLIITEDVPIYALQHIEKIMYTVETQTLEKPVKEIDLRFRLPVLRTET